MFIFPAYHLIRFHKIFYHLLEHYSVFPYFVSDPSYKAFKHILATGLFPTLFPILPNSIPDFLSQPFYTGYFTSDTDNEPGGIENATHNTSGGKTGSLSPPCPGLRSNVLWVAFSIPPASLLLVKYLVFFLPFIFLNLLYIFSIL
jgi:hypothetical protein